MNITDELRLGAPARSADDDDLRALRKREWAVLGVLLVLAIITYFSVKRIVVDGVSMQPTFKSGQSVIVWTRVPISSLRAGDVIVFRSPDKDEYIKRIVFIQNKRGTAHPPDEVPTPEGSQPFDYVFGDLYKTGVHPDKPIDDRRIWVMGDNFDHSEDSRDFGPIAPKSVLGKVIM